MSRFGSRLHVKIRVASRNRYDACRTLRSRGQHIYFTRCWDGFCFVLRLVVGCLLSDSCWLLLTCLCSVLILFLSVLITLCLQRACFVLACCLIVACSLCFVHTCSSVLVGSVVCVCFTGYMCCGYNVVLLVLLLLLMLLVLFVIGFYCCMCVAFCNNEAGERKSNRGHWKFEVGVVI